MQVSIMKIWKAFWESSDKAILLLPDMIWYAHLFFSSLSKWSLIRNLINRLSWLSGWETLISFSSIFFLQIDGKIISQWVTEKQGRHSECMPITSSLTILFFSNTPPNTHIHTLRFAFVYNKVPIGVTISNMNRCTLFCFCRKHEDVLQQSFSGWKSALSKLVFKDV